MGIVQPRKNHQQTVDRGTLAAQLAAIGYPASNALVLSVTDTGRLIDYDPVVNLVVDLDGTPIDLQTLVSTSLIPRPGDTVVVMNNPQAPGSYLYGGRARS